METMSIYCIAISNTAWLESWITQPSPNFSKWKQTAPLVYFRTRFQIKINPRCKSIVLFWL